MGTTIAGVEFDFSTGAPHTPDRQLYVTNRHGGTRPIIQVLSALSPPFTVQVTKMCADATGVHETWQLLRQAIGTDNEAVFDTGLTLTHVVLLAIGQPRVRVLAGCSPSVEATFNLTLRSYHVDEAEALMGEAGFIVTGSDEPEPPEEE